MEDQTNTFDICHFLTIVTKLLEIKQDTEYRNDVQEELDRFFLGMAMVMGVAQSAWGLKSLSY